MANLCNGTAFHVDGHRLGETVEYLLHFLTRIDKPLSTDSQTTMHLTCLVTIDSLSDQLLWASETSRHTHDLSVLNITATIGIMIYTLRGYHHIHHVQFDTGPPATPVETTKSG